jgi:uncharacterized protein
MKTLPLGLKQNIGIAVGAIAFGAAPWAIAIFSTLPSYALTVQEVPNPRQSNNGWVTDSANILSNSTENELNRIIFQLESDNGTEIAVVTVPETSPSPSPKEFATELFNYWGIGKADRDNGILLLISVGDRRTEIETGYGIESILPDAKVGNIIDTQITPYVKQKQFDEGTLAGTKALIAVVEASEDRELKRTNISSEESTEISSRNISTKNNDDFIGLMVLFLLSLVMISLMLRKHKVFVRPDEFRKRIRGWSNSIQPVFSVFCATCKKKMEKVDETQVNNELSKPEKIAQKIGSVKFEGWRCPKCSHHPVIIGCPSTLSMFKKCHNCQELTVSRTKKTLKYSTTISEGKRLVTDKCHCCGYYRESQEIIPRLSSRPSSTSTHIWTNSSSSSSSNYGGSSCSGSSYSGGGDFGGGSSGGGGGGGSW